MNMILGLVESPSPGSGNSVPLVLPRGQSLHSSTLSYSVARLIDAKTSIVLFDHSISRGSELTRLATSYAVGSSHMSNVSVKCPPAEAQ